VSPGWVERRLNISRATRLSLEERGALIPVRLTAQSHRRYRLAEVEALLASPVDAAPALDGPQVGEATPSASPATPHIEGA